MNLNSLRIDSALIRSIFTKRPIFVAVLLTHRCNLKCDFCVFWKRDIDVSKEMKPADHAKVSDLCKKIGTRVVNLAGGEPFIRQDLEEIIGAYQKDHLVIINSNGTLIDKERAKSVWKSGLDVINISIDFFDRDMHDEVRGKGVYDKAMDAIQLLKSAKTKKSQRIAVQAIYSPQNAHQFDEFIRYCQSEDIEFSCNPYRPDPDHEVHMDFSPDYSVEHLRELKKKYPAFKISNYAIRMTDYYIKNGFVPNCGTGKYMFALDPYGNFTPCENRINEPFANISDPQLTKKVMQKLLDDVYTANNCHMCYSRERSDIEYLYQPKSKEWWSDILPQSKSLTIN